MTILHGEFISLIICKSLVQSLYSVALQAFKGLWFVLCLQNFPCPQKAAYLYECRNVFEVLVGVGCPLLPFLP